MLRQEVTGECERKYHETKNEVQDRRTCRASVSSAHLPPRGSFFYVTFLLPPLKRRNRRIVQGTQYMYLYTEYLHCE